MYVNKKKRFISRLQVNLNKLKNNYNHKYNNPREILLIGDKINRTLNNYKVIKKI